MLAVPPNNLPTITITEIMYDAPGADTGHEWVEFQNTGSDPVSTAGWRFFEGGVNHKLAAQRSSTLAGEEYVVIANDAEKFSADHPSYSGALFQSSFSLGNNGETIAIKNASAELASLTYASQSGASGDGNTLNLINGTWVPRSPSPGASASASALAPKAPTPKSSASKPKGNPTSAAAVSMATVATGSQSFGILPWMFGLAAVIMAGVGAIFLMPSKNPEDEYKIIEEKS